MNVRVLAHIALLASVISSISIFGSPASAMASTRASNGDAVSAAALAAQEAPNGLSGAFGESKDSTTVVPATGGMTYAIPFELPANRGNAQPSLRLTYESGARTGEAGLGWSLSLPSIERAPLSGWPKYLDDGVARNEDRFTYGGRPLTFICVVGGIPACPINEQIGPMPAWANGYRHYRLQVEGSFERFFWSPPSDRWIVQQRGGNILEFGLALTLPDLQLASAYETDAPSGRTFRWYLAVQRDLHAEKNIVFYRWASDGQGTRKYLREIYYAPPPNSAAVSPLSAWAYHVELRWENPPYRQKDATFADKRPHYKRLRRVAVSAKPWSGGTDRELVRAYNLTYYPERGEARVDGEAPLWGRSSLASVQMEGRCTTPTREINGVLPDPTDCPMLPAQTFEYAPATLAFGAASYVALGTPGTSEALAYPSSSAVIDINRDGLPDVLQAWPTNYSRRPAFSIEYNECRHGDFLVDPGPNPYSHRDPQLVCEPNDDDKVYLRSARAQKAWVNRGVSAGALTMQHYCLDAGGVEPRTPTYYQIAGPQGYGSREPALFTQYGAEAVGEWGNGALLWSMAGYHAFGFAPAKMHVPDTPVASEEYDQETYREFCPESATNSSQPALRWVKTGDASWSKDAQNDDAPKFRHLNIVDIDGDGYGDLLTEPATPARDVFFERAAVRFTRKISRQESINGVSGPALVPFTYPEIGREAVMTVTPSFAEYSTYADMNGDGIVDLITANKTFRDPTPEVRLGDGRGGFGCDPSTDIACQVPGNGDWLGRAYRLFTPDRPATSPFDPKPWPLVADSSYTLSPPAPAHFFRDVTGDGLADLIKYEPSVDLNTARLLLWVNVDGRTFRCANVTDCVVATIGGATPTTIGLNKIGFIRRILFTDVDGDGTEDFILIAARGMWSFSFLANDPVPPVGPRSPQPGLLTRIRNGVGADTEIVYETIQELDLAANSADYESFDRPWTTHVPQVLTAVTRIATRDTPSVLGAPLPEPYQISRTRRFAFRDPTYDPWQRAFKGFRQVRSIAPSGEVEQTWFYYGACEAGAFVDPACLRGSDGGNDGGAGNSDYPDKPLAGVVARVDRFVPRGGREPSQWLSTQTMTYDVDSGWIQPAGLRPDRPVVLARVAQVDTYLYDTAAPVSMVNEIDRQPRPERVPWQAGRVHVRSDVAYDAAGNVLEEEQHGRVKDAPDGPLDVVITTSYLPAQGRCGADWACLSREMTTSDLPSGMLVDRPLRHFKFQYNDTGDLIEVLGRLFATSGVQAGLERDLVRGVSAPPSAQTAPGWKTLRKYDVDDLGNVIATRGAPGPNQACARVMFDASFRQFPQIVSQFSGAGCTGKRLSEELVYDRGLGVVLETSSWDRTLRRMEMDEFGRLTKAYDSAPDANPTATELAVEVSYHSKEPVSWIEVNQRVDIDEFVSSIDIFNGVGEPVLGFDEADPVVDGFPWILRDWTERDANGRGSAGYRPWFFSGDALAVADTAAAITPQGLRATVYRDAFGRPNIAFDGSLAVAEYAYMPLKITAKDAEQLKAAGPFSGLEATVVYDGHGRTIETTTPSANDRTTTRVEYLGTGEVTALSRSSDYDPVPYERQMQWDSFGRMIVNTEPNTSGRDASGAFRAWRYVYDDEGRLAGTSDARGCGKNLYYDALGRIRAEDFSPCADGQPAYTAPDLVTGDGTEGFYRYDAYPAGTVEPRPAFANHAESALGRLVSIQDLGAYTRFSYDERGRVRRRARQVVKPGLPQAALADRYTEQWFKQEVEFDLGNRLRKRTLGLTNEPFPAESFETLTFSARGMPREIGSSFGLLASELRYSTSGLPLNVKYGDLAGTRTVMGYDAQNLLRKWRTSRVSAPALWSLPSTPAYSQPNGATTQLDLINLEFSYDDVGNILSINDGSADSWPTGARPVSRAFTYDPAYRLTQVDYLHGGDNQVPASLAEGLAGDRGPVAEQIGQERIERQSFVSDWQGNVTLTDDNESLRFDRSLGEVLNGTGLDGQKHGPNQLIDADGIHAVYDAAGNLTELTVARAACWDRMPDCSHRFRYDWNEIGQLARARRWDYAVGVLPADGADQVPVWDVTYAYSEGGRTRKSVASAAGSVRHTLDVFDTLRIHDSRYQTATSTYEVAPENQIGFAGGVARVFADRAYLLPLAGLSPVHVYFSISDYLGSSTFLIDKDSGEVVERTSYQPYGAVESDYRPDRWGAGREEFKFTDKEEDIEVGVTYFGARYYNAHLGRWMSPDPLTIHGLGSDLNPYAYVGGRVISHVDPLGLDACGGDGTVDCVEVKGPPRGSAERHAELAAARGEAMASQATTPRPISIVRPQPPLAQTTIANAETTRQKEYQTEKSLWQVFLENGSFRLDWYLFGQPTKKPAVEVLEGTVIGPPVALLERGTVTLVAGPGGRLVSAAEGKAATLLGKQLASEAQLGEMLTGVGDRIAGAGTAKVFRNAERIARTYGGMPADWVKMSSSGFRAADGTAFATHWVENLLTGAQVEAKVVIDIFGGP